MIWKILHYLFKKWWNNNAGVGNKVEDWNIAEHRSNKTDIKTNDRTNLENMGSGKNKLTWKNSR